MHRRDIEPLAKALLKRYGSSTKFIERSILTF
jgi:hypothetical protein